MRALDIEPVHDTRATFRALCDAMSRPGTVQQVPTTPADHAVVATLVDHEVTTHTDDDELLAALSARGRLETAPPQEAQIVHVDGVPSWDIRNLDRGSLLEPSRGATVIYHVEALDTKPSSGKTSIQLSGPGIPDSRTVSIGLPGDELTAIADAQSTYPRGVDAVFTTEDEIMALPRSVSMEVV